MRSQSYCRFVFMCITLGLDEFIFVTIPSLLIVLAISTEVSLVISFGDERTMKAIQLMFLK